MNIGKNILNPEWKLLGDMVNNFPKDVPLYKSAQYNLGTIKMDPIEAIGLDHFSE